MQDKATRIVLYPSAVAEWCLDLQVVESDEIKVDDGELNIQVWVRSLAYLKEQKRCGIKSLTSPTKEPRFPAGLATFLGLLDGSVLDRLDPDVCFRENAEPAL
jgi:hypothetical protein